MLLSRAPKENYFKTLKLEDSVVIWLGNNHAFKIDGIDMVRLKMFDDHEFLLHYMRYVLELKNFFIHKLVW